MEIPADFKMLFGGAAIGAGAVVGMVKAIVYKRKREEVDAVDDVPVAIAWIRAGLVRLEEKFAEFSGMKEQVAGHESELRGLRIGQKELRSNLEDVRRGDEDHESRLRGLREDVEDLRRRVRGYGTGAGH